MPDSLFIAANHIALTPTAFGNLWSIHARYTSVTNQAIAPSTDVVAAFGTDQTLTDAVVKSTDGAGHRFTFAVGGIWAVTSTTRFTNGSAGERYSALVSDNYGTAQAVTALGGSSTTLKETMNLAYTGYFPAGSYVRTQVYQTGNSPTLDLEGNVQWKNINFALIHPEIV